MSYRRHGNIGLASYYEFVPGPGWQSSMGQVPEQLPQHPQIKITPEPAPKPVRTMTQRAFPILLNVVAGAAVGYLFAGKKEKKTTAMAGGAATFVALGYLFGEFDGE